LKTIFDERLHALTKNIETKEAESYPGVIAVLTAKDVPNYEFCLIVPD